MSRASGHFVPPTRDGVGPSCVGLPSGSWPTMLDFLSERFTAIPRERWQARMAAGEVWDEHGAAVTVQRPYQHHLRLYYYRDVPVETPIPFEPTNLFHDEHLLVVDVPDATQAALGLINAAPDRVDSMAAAFQQVDFALGGAFLSRINLNLREVHGWTYGVHMGWDASKVNGRWTLQTVLTAENLAEAAGEIRKELARNDQKLGNEQFVSRAPEEVVEEQRERRAESLALLARTEAALARLPDRG